VNERADGINIQLCVIKGVERDDWIGNHEVGLDLGTWFCDKT
jgi:hypothetical protein